MACNLETLLIEKSDFDCIGQVAKHCSWDQLCIFIREQQNLYLLPKIGYCLFSKLMANPTDTVVQKLLCGGEYTGCNGIVKYQFGLKRVLVHASYAAYIYRHGFIDTPFGVVQKLNQDSLPAPIIELKSIKNEHYTNAELYFEGVKDFICTVKDNELFKDCFCENSFANLIDYGNFIDSIHCNSCCGKSEVQTQRRQYSFSNIEK